MANIDFEFDFDQALACAYHDDAIYQRISDISKSLDLKTITTEKAIRDMIKINSSVLSAVLKQYNHELLNEL